MRKRMKAAVPVSLVILSTACADVDAPGVASPTAESAQPVLNGLQRTDDVWEKEGRAARLQFTPLGNAATPTDVSNICTAVPLADQWLLTAAHCLFGANRAVTKERIGVNRAPAPAGIWDGTGTPKPTDNWVAIPHPSRDLALIHRWPLAVPTERLPKLAHDPPMSASPVGPSERFDSILGFGCTTGSTAGQPGSELTLFEGRMRITSPPAPSPAGPKISFSSWAARAVPDPGAIAGGDSGGPAFTDRSIPVFLLGDQLQQRWLTGINYIAESADPFPTKCPWKPGAITVTGGGFTTFDVKSDGAGLVAGPAPIEWINATRTSLAKRAPTPVQPPKTATIPATVGEDGGAYPDVAWFDLDGDGLHDLYAWGTGTRSATRRTRASARKPPSSPRCQRSSWAFRLSSAILTETR